MLMVRLSVAVRCCLTVALISKTIRWLFRLFFIYIIFLLSLTRSLSHPYSLSEKIYLLSSFVFFCFFFHSEYCYRCVQIMGIFVFIDSNASRERMRKMIWNALRNALFQKMLIINYLLIIFWWHWYKCVWVCLPSFTIYLGSVAVVVGFCASSPKDRLCCVCKDLGTHKDREYKN